MIKLVTGWNIKIRLGLVVALIVLLIVGAALVLNFLPVGAGATKLIGSYDRGFSYIYVKVPKGRYSRLTVALRSLRHTDASSITGTFDKLNPKAIPLTAGETDTELFGWALTPSASFNGLIEIQLDNEPPIVSGLICFYQEPNHEEIGSGGARPYRCNLSKYALAERLAPKLYSKSYSMATTPTKLAETVLYASFPNFNKLTLADLPSFDFRRVFDYAGKKIIVGYPRIVEYDAVNDRITRASLKTGPKYNSAAKIGSLLYVSDNGDYVKKLQPTIYVVDLVSGKILATLEGLKAIPYDLTNNSLHAYKNDLWIATRNEIIKYDTVLNKVQKAYPLADLGYTANSSDCNNSPDLIDEEGSVKVVEFGCGYFISTYNYATDSWTVEKFPNLQPSDYINRGPADFKLDTPVYRALSRMVNDTYYVLASNGIYNIKRNTLPELVYKQTIKLHYGKTFIETSDGTTFLIVSIDEYTGPGPGTYYDSLTVSDVFSIKILDAASGIQTDLLKGTKLGVEKFTKYRNGWYDAGDVTSATSFGVFALLSGDGTELLKINLMTKEVTL